MTRDEALAVARAMVVLDFDDDEFATERARDILAPLVDEFQSTSTEDIWNLAVERWRR